MTPRAETRRFTVRLGLEEVESFLSFWDAEDGAKRVARQARQSVDIVVDDGVAATIIPLGGGQTITDLTSIGTRFA